MSAGLVKRHEERGNIFDAFRNRVMTPIRDRMGRVVGFGGRVLDDSKPKYLNTAETPVFHKSHVIYGIDLAYDAIRTANRVVIVEGYMDVIAAHQFGFTNVVACMGTALTTEQLHQLQRYTSNFVLALDADAAGQQATIRGLNQARQSLERVSRPAVRPGGGLRMEERLGANLLVCSMPEGQDPDDVIRRDPALWESLIGKAKPLVEYYLGVVARQIDLSSAAGKGAMVSELAPLIAELDSEIERQHYIQELSRLVQIDELTVAGRVQAAAKTSRVPPGRRASPPAVRGPRGRGASPAAPASAPLQEPPDYAAGYAPEDGEYGGYGEFGPPPEEEGMPLRGGRRPMRRPARVARPVQSSFGKEEYLLACLLHNPDLLVWLAAEADVRKVAPPATGDWQHVENQEIFRALRLYIAGDAHWDVELFQEGLTSHLHGRLEGLLAGAAMLPPSPIEDLRIEMLKVLVRMRMDRLKSDNTHIKFLIDDAQRSGDLEAVRSFDAINNHNLRTLSFLQDTWVGLTRVLAVQGRAEKGVKIR